MALFDDCAVVLRRLDYSETSQIVVMFTRLYGKVRLIAKGIKRSTKTRFAPAIDLLELGHLVWSARPGREHTLSTLTEWKQIQGFSGLRDKLQRLYAAQYAGEVTSELLADGDPHAQLFDALVAYLERTQFSDDPLLDLCLYQRMLLMEIGLMPQCTACAGCGRKWDRGEQQIYFSSHQGGFVCRDCEGAFVEKRMVDFAAVQAVAGGTVADGLQTATFDLLNYHISHIMGKEPKLAEYVLPAALRRKLGSTPV